MVKIYFLGGDIGNKYDEQVSKRAVIAAGEHPSVLVIPWTTKIIRKDDPYRKITVDYFRDLGAKHVEFLEIEDSPSSIKQKIDLSDLIYLPGGITDLLVKRVKKQKIDTLLRKYDGVVVGNSAGALAICKDCVITKDGDNPKTKVIRGFGLVDFSTEVHYNSSNDEELKKLSLKRKIYAISERSSIIYDSGKLEFIGNVYLFDKGKKTKCE